MIWLSGAKRCVEGKSIFKVIAVVFGLLIGLLIVVAATTAFVFRHSENERKQLIASYQIPPYILAKILALEGGPISALMENGEMMACTINAYAGVDKVSFLSDRQKTTLPKSRLPSEDRAWYLLFFTNASVSRIYFIENDTIDGTASGSDLCISHDGHFEILKRQDVDRKHFVLRLTSKEIKK